MFKIKSLWPIRGLRWVLFIFTRTARHTPFVNSSIFYIINVYLARFGFTIFCFVTITYEIPRALKPYVHNTQSCERHFCTHSTTQWFSSALECIKPICFIYDVWRECICALRSPSSSLCAIISYDPFRQSVYPCWIWPDSSNGIICDDGTQRKWWCSQSTDKFMLHIKQVAK